MHSPRLTIASPPVSPGPSPLARLAKFLGLSLAVAGVVVVTAALGVSWWLWHLVSSAVAELADGTQLNPHLREALLRMGQAFIIVGTGYFLTLNFRRWQRGLFRILLGFAAIPLVIFLTSLVTNRGADGLALQVRQVDPAVVEWFDGKTGAPMLWWGPGDAGEPEFFNRPGHHPRTGGALLPVDASQRAGWLRQRKEEKKRQADAMKEAAAAKARQEDALAAASLRAKAAAEAKELRENTVRETAALRAQAEELHRTSTREMEALRKERMEAAKIERAEAVRADTQGALDLAALLLSSAKCRAGNSLPAEEPTSSAPPPAARAGGPPPGQEPPSQYFRLPAGRTLDISVRGDKVAVWSDGPIEASADGGSFQRLPQPFNRLRFQGGNAVIHVRPLSRQATMLYLRKL